MKLTLLLALLFGAASALHLRAETPNYNSPLEKETLPEDEDVPEQEAEDAPTRELALLEDEEEDSGNEDALEKEEDAELGSVPGEMDKDFQCPRAEDTVNLVGIPGSRANQYILVRPQRSFTNAQAACQKCFRGNLVSIHSTRFNVLLQRSVRQFNSAQVWIGGRVVGSGICRHFSWIDGSSWNFSFWASGQPSVRGGDCVTLCTRGGHWRRASCQRALSFICAY
ncbi:bone marrow proteoglycan [Tamandua tetradactyla]|uniref:bone marrow proteoglycan n=1 Tax=Tamandua tetradactyla TaxID=48850 RepID=UPI0040545C9D